MSKYDESRVEEEEIDLGVLFSDMWRGFKKYWGYMFLIIILCTAGAIGCTMVTYKPMYKAQMDFTLSTNANDKFEDTYSYNYSNSTASLMANTFPYIIESSVLQDIIKDDLGVERIDAKIAATAVENTNMFSLSVVSEDPEWSYRVLVSVIENYPKITQYVIGDTSLNRMSELTIPEEPYNGMSYVKNTAVGLLFGIVLCGVILIVYAMSRKTIRKEDDIEEVLGQECLGVLPQIYFKKSSNKSKVVSIEDKRVAAAYIESIRSLRVRIQKMENTKVLMVTGTKKDEGSSSLAMNLAYALEKDKKRVVLIDADWKNPSLCTMMGIKTEGGLAEAVRNKKIGGYLKLVNNRNLGLLASSKPENDAYSVLNSEILPVIMEKICSVADYVIIDGGSGDDFENVRLADLCDAVLYVVRQDRSSSAEILNVIETLSYSQARFAGIVFNGVTGGFGGYGYSYGKYGYGKYGYGKYGYGKYGYGYGNAGKK